MKNKGYYHWIHSLNEAALQSQKKGFEMLSEAKKTGPSRQVRNYLPGQIERQAQQLTPQETAAAGLGRLMKDIEVMTPELAKSMTPQLFDAGRHIAERPGTVFPDNPVDDIGEIGKAPASVIKQEIANASAAKMRAATASANAARSVGPVNVKPVGDAQAVEDDANDWEMADPIVHPAPQFASPEAANAEVARLNAAKSGMSDKAASDAFERKQMVDVAKQAMIKAGKAGKNAAEQREAGRSALRDYQGLRQQELSAEPPADDELYRLSTPSAKWKSVKEDRKVVSNKITKLIQESSGNDI
jgi:hypothetical protein